VKERDLSEDLVEDGRILKCIEREHDVRMWHGLICSRMWTTCRLLCTLWWTVTFHKNQQISFLAQELVDSQKEPSSMQSVEVLCVIFKLTKLLYLFPRMTTAW